MRCSKLSSGVVSCMVWLLAIEPIFISQPAENSYCTSSYIWSSLLFPRNTLSDTLSYNRRFVPTILFQGKDRRKKKRSESEVGKKLIFYIIRCNKLSLVPKGIICLLSRYNGVAISKIRTRS